MAPGIRSGTRAWAESLSYHWRRPRRGELVLVRPPGQRFRVLKRVGGVPGDTVDGRALAADEYFVLGDNPAASTDSRTFGPVPASAIEARVLL